MQKTELPKWPFLTGDIVLILLACFIVIASPKPMTSMGIFACALSVILGMLVFITPYIIEHLTQQQRIKLKQAEAEETLLKTAELASDLLSRTESIHAELMKGVLSVKQVPVTIEEKTEELSEVLDSETLASSITELSDLLTRLEAQNVKGIDTAKDDTIEQRLDEILNTMSSQGTENLSHLPDLLESKLAVLKNEILEKLEKFEVSQDPETVEHKTVNETENLEEESERTDLASNEIDHSSVEIQEGGTPLNEETVDRTSEEMEFENSGENDDTPDSSILDQTEDSDSLVPDKDILPPSEGEESSVQHNEDGATRLLIGAFIGISNKLYIRGEGPGLDWDKGIPMELVGIGKWEWKTYDASSTVNCKVLINDEQWTDTENIEIEPNTTVETTASF